MFFFKEFTKGIKYVHHVKMINQLNVSSQVYISFDTIFGNSIKSTHFYQEQSIYIIFLSYQNTK